MIFREISERESDEYTYVSHWDTIQNDRQNRFNDWTLCAYVLIEIGRIVSKIHFACNTKYSQESSALKRCSRIWYSY